MDRSADVRDADEAGGGADLASGAAVKRVTQYYRLVLFREANNLEKAASTGRYQFFRDLADGIESLSRECFSNVGHYASADI